MVRLDHNNINATDLAATIAFYEDVIGLRSGDFPGRPGQGAWLYDDSDTPVVHVVAVDPPADGRSACRGSGAIDHMAFRCGDYDGMKARIEDRGLAFRCNDVPSIGLRQLFVDDPSGITVELNFRD